MVIYRKTRLTPIQRKQLSDDCWKKIRVCDLIRKYNITAPIIYKIIHQDKHRDYTIRKSINKRFRCLQYGIKRLSKIEKKAEAKLEKQARRYNKKYQGEMLYFDTKRLPLLKGESVTNHSKYFLCPWMIFQENCILRFYQIKPSIQQKNS